MCLRHHESPHWYSTQPQHACPYSSPSALPSVTANSCQYLVLFALAFITAHAAGSAGADTKRVVLVSARSAGSLTEHIRVVQRSEQAALLLLTLYRFYRIVLTPNPSLHSHSSHPHMVTPTAAVHIAISSHSVMIGSAHRLLRHVCMDCTPLQPQCSSRGLGVAVNE